MKVLIAYDGSAGASYAIQDLAVAGLGSRGVQAKVLTVGEYIFEGNPVFIDPQMPLASFTPERMKVLNELALTKASRTADEGCKMVREMFGEWEVEACSRLSSPASTILEIAKAWKPDLIVIGSHGRSALGRLFIGSVSLRVATEAQCAVRIVKHAPKQKAPKIMLAFDGSAGSRAAVHSLVHRSWPMGTALHVATVVDISLAASLDYVSFVGGDLYQSQKNGETRIEHLMHSVECEMKKQFGTVTSNVRIGSAATELVHEAEAVKADMIFVGSHSYAKLERLLLGSVSHAIATRSKATVEIVR